MSPDTATPAETPPNAKLTPLHAEAGFIAALIVGLPALVFAYVLGWNLIEDAGSTPVGDAAGTIAALVALLAGNPITVYLTARQYPRGKSVEAIGMADAVRVQAEVSTTDADAEWRAEFDAWKAANGAATDEVDR